MPDGTVSVEDQTAERDQVVTRWRFRGTNTGPFLGNAPTGREVSVTGTHIHRIVDGKIVEIWAQPGALTFRRHLGLLPATARRRTGRSSTATPPSIRLMRISLR